MPAAPTLPTSITAGVTTGHASGHVTAHTIINNIYKAEVPAAQTGSFTIAQSQSGELIRADSASAIVVTVPTLEVGTVVEIVRMGAGSVTLSTSGTTLRVPTGATASCRVQFSSISLVWLTTTEVLVGGDLT